VRLLRAEPLRAYNTLALESRAAALARVGSEEEVLAACRWAREHSLEVIPLGEGSNVVIAGDLDALVLRQASRGIELVGEEGREVVLRVAAGENWHQLVHWTLAHGFYGLENLALIPGTVGAAPVQNIGAYGVELCAFVVAVHAVSIEGGERVTLCNGECAFAYRDSAFKHRLRDALVICAVDLRLSRQPALRIGYPALAEALAGRGRETLTPADVFDAVVGIRRAKLPDPQLEPNAGSFFKNPVLAADQARLLAGRFPGLPLFPHQGGEFKTSAAWLIERCGWKGWRRGGVGVHPGHALVLVNYGSDSGAELLALAAAITRSVAETFGVRLEVEPRIYGAAA
jgi:UDP-N-acetylmuramate dehydrogenase